MGTTPFSNKTQQINYLATQALVSEYRIWLQPLVVIDGLQTKICHRTITRHCAKGLRPVWPKMHAWSLSKMSGSPFRAIQIVYDSGMAINHIMDSQQFHAMSIEDRNIRANLIQKLRCNAH